MNSSAKIMKATGIIHIIHGIIMGLLMLAILLFSLSSLSALGGLFLFALTMGISFLYIYIGYELFSLRNADKTKNLLIASIILACIEVLVATAKGQTAGVIFIIELIMSIVAICNIDSYREYKKPTSKK